MRSTRQRETILEVLEKAGGPLSPQEILEAVRARVPSTNLATVYRAIQLFLEKNWIGQVALPGEPPRYESARVAAAHHHHFRCDGCNAVFDLSGCPGGLARLLPRGFRLRGHDLTLYGTCASCR